MIVFIYKWLKKAVFCRNMRRSDGSMEPPPPPLRWGRRRLGLPPPLLKSKSE
jgi:hypothetical protein